MIDLKEYVKTLGGKSVLVFGLGKTGHSLIRALHRAGAKIVVGDDDPQKILELNNKDVFPLQESDDFSKFAMVLLSPGVPLSYPAPHAVVMKARAAGVDVIGDMELWHRAGRKCKTIGITGTNGKSTTTALVHHILKYCGRAAVLGGNIGTPVMDLEDPGSAGVAVLEISSYQMDLSPTFRPDIAVILNITPDHIDRHGDMKGYSASKGKIVDHVSGVAVLGVDDKFTKEIFSVVRTRRQKAVPVSVVKVERGGVYVLDGFLVDAIDGQEIKVGLMEELRTLRGMHNYQNAACAYAACRAMGLEGAAIFTAMKNFSGLQHRQYLVRTINGVGYINDSKATNAAATAVALGAYNNIYWIIGGRKKETGLAGLEGFLDRIKHAFLIGECEAEFSKWCEVYGVPYTRSQILDNAVAASHKMAQDNRGQPGGAGVVLLSPACASFDQYKSFEERGQHFCRLVQDLRGEI